MARNEVPVLNTQMHEREAFRAIFSFGGALRGLSSRQVGGLEAAVGNAQALAAEVIGLLKGAQPEQAEVAA